jgi:hypothetical protein
MGSRKPEIVGVILHADYVFNMGENLNLVCKKARFQKRNADFSM